jgi:predicted ATPase
MDPSEGGRVSDSEDQYQPTTQHEQYVKELVQAQGVPWVHEVQVLAASSMDENGAGNSTVLAWITGGMTAMMIGEGDEEDNSYWSDRDHQYITTIAISDEALDQVIDVLNRARELRDQ